MSGEKKSIIINKNYLTMGKSKKKKPKINNLLKGVSMKNKLLKEVKKHHNKSLKTSLSQKNNHTNTSTDTSIDSLDDSISYLENIIKKKKEKVRKQREQREQQGQREQQENKREKPEIMIKSQQTQETQETHQLHQAQPRLLGNAIPINLDNPMESSNIALTPRPFASATSVNAGVIPGAQVSQKNYTLKTAPPFGILKGGKKPTYRQYYNIETKRRGNNPSKPIKPLTIERNDTPIVSSVVERKEKLKSFINDYNKTNSKNKKRNKKRIKLRSRKIKKTRKLGKNKSGKVGVLIKDLKTRKNIEKEHNILKKIPIQKIRSYLQKHGLLKNGSNAPEHIMRKIYEDSFLSGDIYNLSDDVLVHNYLNTLEN